MRAAIIGLLADGSVDLELESDYERPLPAIHVEETHFLNGEAPIYTGTAAGTYVAQEIEPIIVDGGISDDLVETTKETVTEFVADPQGGWVGIDTSKAEFLWNLVQSQTGSLVECARIDVDGLAGDLGSLGASVWQVGWSGPGDDHAGSVYHDDADVGAAEGPLSQFGFSVEWRGIPVRGTVAESGYLAAYNGLGHAETFAQFVRDMVLPHAELPETDQMFLEEVSNGGE